MLALLENVIVGQANQRKYERIKARSVGVLFLLVRSAGRENAADKSRSAHRSACGEKRS